MRIDVKTPKLTETFKTFQTSLTKAVQKGTQEATDGLKTNLRNHITRAGMGNKLANTWRSKYYPNDGLNPAGLVFSKAPQIIRAFDEGALIKAKAGKYLAIPTAIAPKRGTDGKKLTPRNFPTARLGELVMIKRRTGPSFLIVENVRASFSKQSGQLRGYRKGSATALKTGRNLSSAIMFLLVPQVQLPKRFDVKDTGKTWANKLPNLIEKNLQTNAEQT